MKLSNQDIIEKFKAKHGNLYDYSKVEYKNARVNVVITCLKHGDFTKTPYKHLYGQGCQKCSRENQGLKRRTPLLILLQKFNEIYQNRYDYSLVKSVGFGEKINIICKIHGIFQKNPHNHLNGEGCPKCVKIDGYNTHIKGISEVLSSFREVHGNRYDYGQVKYKTSNSKVKIICIEHGIFEQTPTKHKSGQGCPKCSLIQSAQSRQSNKSDIINKFIKVHGNRYDYSQVEYYGSDKKVKIICHEHGIFEVNVSSHINGTNCPKCARIEQGLKRRTPIKDLIEEFIKIHGLLYDYSKVQSVGAGEKIILICKEHGEFQIKAIKHLAGQGCSKCGIIARGKSQRKALNELLSEFIEVHGNRYDYSQVEYFGNHTKVKIICQEHGLFEQAPAAHINGTNCPKCTGNKIYSANEILMMFSNVHGNKYDYSLMDYKLMKSKVKIKCKLHGVFEQTPRNHFNGQGCPICNHGWSKNKLIDFVSSIENNDLLNMDSIELQLIINQVKLHDALETLVFNSEGTREHTIKALKESLMDYDALGTNEESISLNQENIFENSYTEIEIDRVQASELDIKLIDNEIQDKKAPISLSNNIDDLHVIDNALVASCDEETVNFLIQYNLRKLWNNVLNEKVDIQKLRKDKGGKNFDILKGLFFKEYDEVISYKPPIGYSFKFPLLPMQQLTVYRVLKNKRYGNWSGTGAGKTISFIVTSRAVESKVTLLIGLNSTINQLADAITEVYPDSKVFKHYEFGTVYNRSESNYLILNYDKFQQGYSEELFQDLSKNNVIDFIGIDEVHNVKQRSEEQESIRRGTLKRLVGRASENNPNLYLLGMSATPVINNLTEARSLLELITGKEYEDLNTTRTLTNALEVFKHMTLNGLRYMPKYDIAIKELDGSNTDELKIDGSEILEKLLSFENNSYLETEQELLKLKLKAIDKYLCKGAIIYSYFTHKMIQPIVEHLRNSGYKVATYTGEESMDTRELNKEAFLKGQIDILVGSRPIGTGVDGLQKVCKRLIILSLPWTDSEFTQLKGRIYRQGSKFNDVEIIIPQVYIPL